MCDNYLSWHLLIRPLNLPSHLFVVRALCTCYDTCACMRTSIEFDHCIGMRCCDKMLATHRLEVPTCMMCVRSTYMSTNAFVCMQTYMYSDPTCANDRSHSRIDPQCMQYASLHYCASFIYIAGNNGANINRP